MDVQHIDLGSNGMSTPTLGFLRHAPVRGGPEHGGEFPSRVKPLKQRLLLADALIP